MPQRVALIGAGMMGEAVLGGLLRSGRCSPADVVIVEKRTDRARELAQRYGVEAVEVAAAAAGAGVVLLVVKPADVAATLTELAPALEPGVLVVSLAAGVSTASLEAQLPESAAVVRVMPNTPAQLGKGIAALSPGTRTTDEQLVEVRELLSGTGSVVEVPEDQQDAVTAVSGSGPAYVFLLAEVMTDAAVALGLPPATAAHLVRQTIVGAAAMLAEGQEPATLRENVTSPGGTTAAALRVLADHQLPQTFVAALSAARDRSRELAQPTSGRASGNR